MIDEIQTMHVLLGATALLAAAATLTVLRFQRKFSDSAAFWNSPIGAALQAGTGEGKPGANEYAAQVAELRQAIEALVRERTPAAAATSADKMENAVLLARQGASVGDLVQCCGLNAGEAQLLLRLHGTRAVVNDAA